MAVFVALLRGINVGGHNKLPMQKFRVLLEKLDCLDVVTYIQSGNAVFDYQGDAGSLPDAIASEIERELGFRPSVLVVEAADFVSVVEANPFHGKFDDPKTMHVSFLQEPATKANLERMTSLAASDEDFELAEMAFYFHAPGGIGHSKLAAVVEKCLGVSATGRNWRTVQKLQALIADKLSR